MTRDEALKMKRMAVGMLRAANDRLEMPGDDETGVVYEPSPPCAQKSFEAAMGDMSRAMDRMFLLIPVLEKMGQTA